MIGVSRSKLLWFFKNGSLNDVSHRDRREWGLCTKKVDITTIGAKSIRSAK